MSRVLPVVPPAVVVLAAGRGSRYGARPKLVEPLGGRSVLATTIARVQASGLPFVVVVGDDTLDEARRCAGRAQALHLPAVVGRQGMGWSIAAGVAARATASGWLVLPGDMPLVRPSSLVAVAQALAHHDLAFAQHRGRRGHPVGFAAELYSELVRLEGDEGARRLVARYASQPVELDDPGVLADVDTPEDLARLRSLLESQPSLAASDEPASPA